MLLGIGTDIVETGRIRAMLERHGSAFVERILTKREIQEAALRRDRVPFLSGRWAAKEALSKALGCGIGLRCAWTEIEILPDAGGKPSASLSGEALKTASSLGVRTIHLSISHERGHAVATVALESEAP